MTTNVLAIFVTIWRALSLFASRRTTRIVMDACEPFSAHNSHHRGLLWSRSKCGGISLFYCPTQPALDVCFNFLKSNGELAVLPLGTASLYIIGLHHAGRRSVFFL